ncbi:MAG: hypothetical protein FWC66_10460, partial [Oscillospiraceae bacterium]|nr:hypothetical protein [Oscillospiraceae bacterium]
TLLSQDLSYIFGDRESGPNGAKSQFLRKGAVFFRALAKDLGFSESNVRVNKAGIAVSGEVYLHGMWGERNGLFIELSQMNIQDAGIMYRTISDLCGKKCGDNHFLTISTLLIGDYQSLLQTFLAYRKQPNESATAA